MELSASENGTRQPVTQGEQIKLSVSENPTTGYRWEIRTPATDVRVVDDSFSPASAAMGSPGIRRFTLELQRPGEITLRLVNRRAWEAADKPPAGEFTVTLEVRP